MTYKLRQGDCLEITKEIPDHSMDMILCDLPYGTTDCKWDSVIPFSSLWPEYIRLIKKNGAIVLFGSQPFTSAMVMSNPKWFKYQWVWNKRFAANFVNAKHQPLKIHEDICVFSEGAITFVPNNNYMMYNPQKTQRDIPIKLGKNKAKRGSANLQNAKEEYEGKVYEDKNPESILFYDTRAEGQVKLHPTQKPVALCEYLIKTYTNEGEWVLDNCMGSGTTGVACINTNRNFIGIEQEPKYFEIAKDRLQKVAN